MHLVRWLIVARVISGMVVVLGVSLLVPLALSLLYRDGSWASFLVPATAMMLVGAAGIRVTRSSGGAGEYSVFHSG